VPKTVNSAFTEFLNETINLDHDKTSTVRKSRDNLINHISDFSGDSDFFSVYSEKNLKFGSFARRTKIRELDDIDLMLCLSAEGTRTYTESTSCIYIYGNNDDKSNNLLTYGTSYLNSTKVINRFISKLSELNDYEKAEMHKNQEAATLKMMSYTWNKRKITITIGSYLLECMILEIYDGKPVADNWWIDLELRNVLDRLSTLIKYDVEDPKGIQGNINYFSSDERLKISNALHTAYEKACDAVDYELTEHDQEKSINKWREVFGNAFPKYDEN